MVLIRSRESISKKEKNGLSKISELEIRESLLTAGTQGVLRTSDESTYMEDTCRG